MATVTQWFLGQAAAAESTVSLEKMASQRAQDRSA